MKAKVDAGLLMSAIKTVGAVQGFGQGDDDLQPGMLSISEESLEIVSARMGAYVAKRCPAQLLREGSFGINIQDLARMKLTGNVTIDAAKDKVKFSDGKASYVWALHESAEAEIKEQRGAVAKISALAKIPRTALQSGAEFATYKSEIKDGYTVQISIDANSFEYAGIDHLSCGRFCMTSDAIKAKQKFHFTLGDTLLSKIITEVAGDVVTIGLSKDGSIVQLATKDFDCYHPTVDKEHMDTDKMIETITADKKKLDCRFDIMQTEAKKAIESVKPVSSRKDVKAKMEILANKEKGAILKQYAQDNAAVYKLEVANLKAKGTAQIIVRSSYFEEFIKVAPKSVPLTVESWNKEFLRILVKTDDSKIEYVAMMLGDQSAD